ncbi:restriction endonuclease [Kitasatospora sp. NPDC002227]|uniref:restriction endonuclease n=1 Tax=Kitasatospora sp. NPDC002227 TaxID=3154773 RepID=UPI003318A5F5
MAIDTVLLESPTMRATVADRVEVLDKVRALVMLPDGMHVTTQGVAQYFEVDIQAIHSLVFDHKAELESNGYSVVSGQRLSSFKELSALSPRVKSLGVFTRRAVLNVAMLLRDSEVARQVRCYLLDAEENRWRQPVDNPSGGVVDNPPFAPGSVDEAVARVSERVVRNVIHTSVTPLLNALIVEVGNNSRKLDAMGDRVDRLERIVLDDEEKAIARRRQRLLRAMDEGKDVEELLG